MPAISVVIITLNEEKNIGRCLRSVKAVADEIVVIDSASTDNTVSIAEQYGARVVQQAFLGYVAQKNFATEQAAHDWVLSLDADEELSTELAESIMKAKTQTRISAYYMPRLTNYCGQWIRHCGWYPDKKIRLYDRNKGAWKGEKVHESWQLHNANDSAGQLKGDLLHYSFASISEHLKKIDKYTELAAEAAVEKGKTASMFKIIFAPKWRFFTDFIIRLGFLDGYYGYIVCRLTAYTTFIKYSKIRSYAMQKRS